MNRIIKIEILTKEYIDLLIEFWKLFIFLIPIDHLQNVKVTKGLKIFITSLDFFFSLL